MNIDWEGLRRPILDLHDRLLNRVLEVRHERGGVSGWGSIDRTEASDVIYSIDSIVEDTLLAWFQEFWPKTTPCELVMEGLESHGRLIFPQSSRMADVQLKVLIDPIDGTRMLMHDKRSAWVLTGIAGHQGEANTLEDIELAVMTELPVSKQGWFDQVSARRGVGASGVQATRREWRNVENPVDGGVPISFTPSQSVRLEHGFGSFLRMLPQGVESLAALQQAFFKRLYAANDLSTLPVFEDQYISTGGQLYELFSGRDRFVCDARGLVFKQLGMNDTLSCHPYDLCTALVARELGCVIERPDGGPLDFPMDTTHPVNWVGYSNPDLARVLRPALQDALADCGI